MGEECSESSSILCLYWIQGLRREYLQWDRRENDIEPLDNEEFMHLLDPVMIISLDLLDSPEDAVSFFPLQAAVPLFLSLSAFFEWTFFDTTYLHLFVDHSIRVDDHNVFLSLVDSFRGFINLEELRLEEDSLPSYLLPHLQHPLPDSVLFPALRSLQLRSAYFRSTSNALLRATDFLRWGREQGFPLQRIIVGHSWIDEDYVLTHIQDTVVEIDDDS